jgi:ribosomal-protein-alanine N-acetyltransferase
MSFRFEEADAHLLLLAVVPDRRRQGVATRIVEWLEVLARRGGIRRIDLEVRESARPARSLYAARGFAQRSRLRGYYQGREDALCLRKTL